MKFQLNLVAALLAACTFAAPSGAAQGLRREGEGDLKLELKKSMDELNGRRLAGDIGIASMMAELNSVPEIAILRGKKKKDSSPQCYIGLEFLDRLAEDPDAICCDMPPVYYESLEQAANNVNSGMGTLIKGELELVCPATTTRPACYSTGIQINCAFNGGQFHILSYATFNFILGPGVDVDDISGLTIEGFTFTGTMTTTPNLDSQMTGSIYLGAPGINASIKNNVFKKISTPIQDGKFCDFPKGYNAVYVEPTSYVGENLFEVTIENNVFENIDTGTYPVYARNNPKDCNLFCYEQTKTKLPVSSLIVNIAHEVNLVGNTFKNVVAQELYFASGGSKSTTENNVVYKNSVHALFTLVNPKQQDVSFVGNEGECNQRYTGGRFCPVRLVGVGDFPIYHDGDPYENCDGSKFCYTENRVSRMNFWIDEEVCDSVEE
eukprot:scaffold1675_cov146-Skeletonema_menzelii.AAC.3